jgi:hypothetical protein
MSSLIDDKNVVDYLQSKTNTFNQVATLNMMLKLRTNRLNKF